MSLYDVVSRMVRNMRPVVDDLKDTSPEEVHRWAKKVVEAIGSVTGDSAQTREAKLESAVTFKDLIDSGIAIEAPKTSDKYILPIGSSANLQSPPAPVGFIVERLPFNMRLSWTAPTYQNHAKTEVWRNSLDNLSLAVKIAEVPAGVNIYEDGYVQGQTWYYWIRFVSTENVIGGFNAVTGTSDNAQPGDVTNLTYALEGFAIRLRWNPVVVEDLDGYEIRLGTTYETATSLGLHKTNFFVYPVQLAGTYRFWLRARDITGFYSGTPTSIDVVISSPSATSLSASIIAEMLSLSWQASAGSFAIDRYEISEGSSYASSTVIAREYATVHTVRVDWVGAKRFWLVAVDVAGNYSQPSFVDVVVTGPGMPQSLAAEIVDNNVLLRWSPPASGTLPVQTYEVLKGETLAGAVSIGEKSGLFTSVFEISSGTYTYWVRARDTAGNVGDARGVTAVVSQPPDYVLYSDLYVPLGTMSLSSAILENGSIALPVNAAETWDQHFSTRSWATPQDQIDAGFPIYAQPAAASGYAEVEIDYGAIIPSTTVSVTPTLVTIAGSPTRTIEISHKQNLGDPYTGPFQGDSYFVPSGFRYVKVRITATTSGGGAGLYRIDALNVRLNTKQKRVDGFGTCSAGHTGGTRFLLSDTEVVLTGNNVSGQDTITGLSTTGGLQVGMSVEGTGIQPGTVIKTIDSSTQITLNQVTTAGTTGGTYNFGMSKFVDLFGPPLVQPKGTTPIIPVVDFVDAPYPLSFRVLLFNNSGARVDGDIAWQARGV